MFKKFLVILAVFLSAAVAFSSLTSTSVSADGPVFSGRSGKSCYVAGFTSWDCGVNISDKDSLKTGIWTIAANVLTDITVVAAYLVLGYVIYAGYVYMSASGDPGKVATGKKTLTQAFIGLAIVLLAHVILNSIRIALLGGGSFAEDCATSECVNPGVMISNAIQWVIAIAGAVAAIFVVTGGIGYITASGDPSKLQRAKTTILYACIGLAIVAFAETITAFVTNIINQAAYTPSINETIISKEVHEIQTS